MYRRITWLITLCFMIPLMGADNSEKVSLFDGKTLNGWTATGGPYDGNASWTVEEGTITGREGPNRAGGLLYTERSYSSFHFGCDVRMTYPFDSGIFIRMAPPGQGKGIQVTLDLRDDGEVGAIYSEKFLMHNQKAKEKFRRNKWNHLEVRVMGQDMHIQAWLNGELITDYRLPEDSVGYAGAGPIAIQVHGNRDDPPGSQVQFKNLWVKELPDFDDRYFSVDEDGFLTLTSAGNKLAWRSLFNGRDLSGWEPLGDPAGYAVRDGLLVFPVEGSDSYIRTEEDFRDFELKIDFKIGRMANSGVFLRGDRENGSPTYSGCEIQVVDDFNWEAVTGYVLKEWQYTGSLYASVPPAVHSHRPIGEWNSLSVRYVGSRLAVTLNGQVLYDVDTFEVPVAYPDQPPFEERAPEGFIGLQRHAPEEVEGNEYAWFRNIFIREIQAESD